MNQLQNDFIFYRLILTTPFVIIISMSCFAKQSAQDFHTNIGIVVFHSYDCLAPAFFLIAILNCSSATSMSVFNAFTFSSASSNFLSASASAFLVSGSGC